MFFFSFKNRVIYCFYRKIIRLHNALGIISPQADKSLKLSI
ncbi:Hypothetical protein ETEE_1600 [Edwardsiella anguillarum ET080813]|uniref:Uncharacterized protein n=1 Tax=Edwardsiella anguillarum ET080813 TaxID=667120 RepID=A0A076LR29_9GAMM|nr:Hypothetical protein ETEE_1600 [Edwardsiella anguillarum ET080813]